MQVSVFEYSEKRDRNVMYYYYYYYFIISISPTHSDCFTPAAPANNIMSVKHHHLVTSSHPEPYGIHSVPQQQLYSHVRHKSPQTRYRQIVLGNSSAPICQLHCENLTFLFFS